ncbi:MAG TPA: DUF3617 family protein [Sphingomonas sp.]|nr:DUF3617 family protein [Sphingomonas sp.]
MAYSWRKKVALATLLSCSVTLASAGLRPQDEGDVVVTGKRPHLDAGLWHFTLWPSHGVSEGEGLSRRQIVTRGHQWDSCVTDSGFEATLMRFLGAGPDGDAGNTCSRMRAHVARGKLNASVTCTFHPPGTMARLDMTQRYYGKLSPAKLDLSTTTVFEQNGERTGDLTGKLTAERVGECPSSTPPASGPAIAPLTIKLIPPPEPPRTDPAPEPAIQPPPPPVGPKPASQPDARSPDDIVVVARKLRKIRLHFASDGRHFSWCHADISSGDPRLDRIGCAIVRSCVEQGYDDQDSALQCFDRKVATLDEPAP